MVGFFGLLNTVAQAGVAISLLLCTSGVVSWCFFDKGKAVMVYSKDATNNFPLAGVVILYESATSRQVRTVTTNSTGVARLDIGRLELPTRVTFSASLAGYREERVELDVTDNSVALSLTPVLTTSDQMRLVMNWGSKPRNLDLHTAQVDGSTGTIVCETAYNKGGCKGLRLDVDNREGGHNGAETITWDDPADYIYLVFIHDYTGDAQEPLAKSQARVAFYGNNNQTDRWSVPTVDSNGGSRLGWPQTKMHPTRRNMAIFIL